MRKLNSTEVTVIFISSGFILGFCISLLVNSLLLRANDLNFSLINMRDIHTSFPLLYFLYLLMPLFMFIGYLFSRYNIFYIQEFDKLKESESKKNAAIRSIIHNLTVGNLNAKIEKFSYDTDIDESLIKLQTTLRAKRENENNRRREDQQQNWRSTGMAQFGDILRTHTKNFEDLGYAVISQLVKYLELNQGGFFLASEKEDGTKYLDLIACHAYERKKFPDREVLWGEGLIGAVAVEKKSYYTNKLTDGYLTITSGLGRANPSYLLIVPLVLNDEVFGVFELASFSPIEDFQIQFIERIAENTATTLNIMESNLRTSKLLEETQAQTVQLAQHEEKVRQNIEELKATQFEAARQSEKFVSFTNSVNHTLIRAEYDVNGILLYANTRFLRKLGYSGNREVEGKHISMFINEKDRDWFNSIWAGLSKGGAHFEGYMKHITKLGQDLWTMATYTCVRKDDGDVDKILFLAIDTTEQKKQIDEMNQKWAGEKEDLIEGTKLYSDILNKLPYPVISINNQGYILNYNRAAEKYRGIKRSDILNSKATSLFSDQQESKLVDAFIDPAKPVKEVRLQKVVLVFHDSREEEIVSILKTEVKSEMFYTMVIHGR